ncbi:MAG: Hsp20/alpha crystallin family protein [Alphaproteobacteria bacterium]|nr:Hsp20/alpha crystallin family protein [Alphaproteobacteria bacterium]
MSDNRLIPWGFPRRGLFEPFGTLQHEVNRLFDDMWRGFEPAASPAGAQPAFAPRMDVSETAEAYRIAMELPGIDDKDVEVSVSDDVLTVKGEKKLEAEKQEGTLHITERSFGSFRRQLRLPADAAADRIEARFEKGVLAISVPKEKEAQTVKKIAVKAG